MTCGHLFVLSRTPGPRLLLPAATERRGTLLRPFGAISQKSHQRISTSIEFLLDMSSRLGTGERRNPVRVYLKHHPLGDPIRNVCEGQGRG